MAAGVPVVASQMGGMPETIEGCGLVVPPGDHIALADALVQLVGDSTLRHRLGVAGLARARQQFAADTVAGQTISVYQKVTLPVL